LLNPEYMMELFTDPRGHKMIFGAVTMQVIGYLIIKKIVHLKV
jgi:Flp pilus assembly protein TadB